LPLFPSFVIPTVGAVFLAVTLHQADQMALGAAGK
jgi:hypothetical protein